MIVIMIISITLTIFRPISHIWMKRAVNAWLSLQTFLRTTGGAWRSTGGHFWSDTFCFKSENRIDFFCCRSENPGSTAGEVRDMRLYHSFLKIFWKGLLKCPFWRKSLLYFILGRSPDSRAKFWGGSLSPKMLEAKQGDITFAVRKIPNLLLKSAKNCDSQCYQSVDLTFYPLSRFIFSSWKLGRCQNWLEGIFGTKMCVVCCFHNIMSWYIFWCQSTECQTMVCRIKGIIIQIDCWAARDPVRRLCSPYFPAADKADTYLFVCWVKILMVLYSLLLSCLAHVLIFSL